MVLESAALNGLVALVCAGAGLAILAAWLIRRDGPRRASGDTLSDGFVLLIDRGRVQRMSPGAQEMLGNRSGAIASEVLQGLFGSNTRTIISALDTLEADGRPFHMMLRDINEKLYEVFARPQGALFRLTIRAAGHMDAELRELTRRLGQTEADHDMLRHQLSALEHIFESGAIVAWTRSPAGDVNWSHGTISTEGGKIGSHDVALVASARAQFGQSTALEPDGPQRARIEIVAQSGEKPVPLDATEVPTGSGEYVGFAVDGSHAASAERSLVRFVKTMTDTFAHLKVGLAIFDRTGKLFLFNPAIATIWRADPVWLARRPTIREIIDELRIKRRLPEREDFHGWRNQLLTLFDNTEAVEFEDLWHLSDGSNIRVLARPHPDGALAFIFDDVTEHVQLEQRYRNSIDLRHAILDRLDEGIAVFGSHGKTQFVNQAFHRVWRLDPNVVAVNTHARDVIPLCSASTREDAVWTRLNGFITGQESRGSWGAKLALTDGRTVSARFVPLPDGSTMAVFADVTDSERISHALRERNEALEAAEAMRSELLDEISHRLRTPLNSVAGFSELLLDERTGPLTETQRSYAENILEASAQLNDAVSGVSDMVEMPSSGIDLGGDTLLVEDLVENTRRLLDRRAGERNVRLRVGLEAPIGSHPCDPARLSQIVFNLAHDAINRCPPGGAVVLGAQRDPDGVLRVWTSETIGQQNPAGMEDVSGIDLIKRQVALENGLVEIDLQDQGLLRVTCRFFQRDRALDAAAEPARILPAQPSMALPAPGDGTTGDAGEQDTVKANRSG